MSSLTLGPEPGLEALTSVPETVSYVNCLSSNHPGYWGPGKMGPWGVKEKLTLSKVGLDETNL